MTSISEWVKSDVFIIFMVVLLVTVIAIFAVCCIVRRRSTLRRTGKMAEVEIIPFASSGRNNKPRFTLKIFTEQKHAAELVQMLTGQIRSTAGPSEAASTSYRQPARAHPISLTVSDKQDDADDDEVEQYYPASG